MHLSHVGDYYPQELLLDWGRGVGDEFSGKSRTNHIIRSMSDALDINIVLEQPNMVMIPTSVEDFATL